MKTVPFEEWFNSLVAEGVLEENDKAVALIGYAGGRELALLEVLTLQQEKGVPSCPCGKHTSKSAV